MLPQPLPNELPKLWDKCYELPFDDFDINNPLRRKSRIHDEKNKVAQNEKDNMGFLYIKYS